MIAVCNVQLGLKTMKQLNAPPLHLISSSMQMVIPFLLCSVGVRPSETKRVLEEAACVSLPHNGSHLEEDTAIYCNPGTVCVCVCACIRARVRLCVRVFLCLCV